MISPETFLNILKNNSIDFFTGVPDSLLKDFLKYLTENTDVNNHVIAANEGGAVALATGYHLATGRMACVYTQNSGIGNALNPLISLADKEVYSIPMLLIIGWRGEPGVKDEPQHIKQGKITEELLDVLSIPYVVFSADMPKEKITAEVSRLIELSQKQGCPCALLIKNGVFEPYRNTTKKLHVPLSMTREEAVERILDSLDGSEMLVSTTGKISRELYEARKRRGMGSENDFLTVGSMGHASQIALGIAHNKKNKQVYCLDGDGAVIMHMGALATVGWVAPPNFKHIVLNNMAHESVGGQPSAAEVINMSGIAKNSNYLFASSVDTSNKLVESLAALKAAQGPAFLEIKVNLESRKDLGRPSESPIENKKKFMDFIGK